MKEKGLEEKWFKDDVHLSTLKNTYPDAYELLTGTTLVEGESHNRDQILFNQKNNENFVVCSAFGDWHKNVPEGFVGVYAKKSSTGEEKCFLVSKEEYSKRGKFGFVIGNHQEIVDFNSNE